jgi:hypothetical protein
MVAIEHDHGSGEEGCPRCEFLEKVNEYVTAAASDGAEEWQHDVGPLIEKMHSALWALQRLWAVEQTNYTDQIDNAGEAARSLIELYELMDDLRPD